MSNTTKILDGKYEVVGVKPGRISTKTGIVDLSKISESQAEQLIAKGTSYLRKSAPDKKSAQDKQ